MNINIQFSVSIQLGVDVADAGTRFDHSDPRTMALCVCRLACKIVSAVISILVLAGIIVLIVFLTKSDDKSAANAALQVPEYTKAAITANGRECADIGLGILNKQGSAADAAIATLFCDGIACPQCMGLGGGFLLTMYTRATGKVEVLNAREVAPNASFEDMFEGGAISTQTGGLASAVPGELRGYGELHRKHGKLPWADLVRPTIELCERGHEVTEYLERILRQRKDRILAEPSLSEIFINQLTNDVWVQGDLIKRPDLAATLEIIAREGPDALHKGSLTKKYVDDVRSFNGIITEEDMNSYQARWLEPMDIDFGTDHVLHTVPLPGSGPLLSFIINTLRGWAFPANIGEKELFRQDDVTFWQRILETFKYTFAKRTGLGDAVHLPIDKIEPLVRNLTSQDYANYIRTLISDTETYNDPKHYGVESLGTEDHGTAHISILAENGDAVAVTSTVNYILGAFRRSRSTGIILNNEMDDFSYPNITNIYGLPPSPNNFVKPKKTPLSSMTPSILVQKGRGARVVLGAAGGTKIPTQVALVLMKHLLLDEPLWKAMNDSRLHHQLFPMEIQHEADFDAALLQKLKDIGHKASAAGPTDGFAALTGISVNRTTGRIDAQSDRRRPGSHAGY